MDRQVRHKVEHKARETVCLSVTVTSRDLRLSLALAPNDRSKTPHNQNTPSHQMPGSGDDLARHLASCGRLLRENAIADFKAEHGPQWSQEMRKKADAYLAVRVEYLGADQLMDQITRQDAAEVKTPVQALPANRKTKPETRDLSLLDAIAVPGLSRKTWSCTRKAI